MILLIIFHFESLGHILMQNKIKIQSNTFYFIIIINNCVMGESSIQVYL